MRLHLRIVAAALLCGCSARRISTVTPPHFGLASDRSYIDVEPGWRLRVITPILSLGGFRLAAKETAAQPGAAVEIRTDGEFLGYETAYYALEPRGTGLRVRLTSVELLSTANPKSAKNRWQNSSICPATRASCG